MERRCPPPKERFIEIFAARYLYPLVGGIKGTTYEEIIAFHKDFVDTLPADTVFNLTDIQYEVLTLRTLKETGSNKTKKMSKRTLLKMQKLVGEAIEMQEKP